jgi:hypothetical protein
MVPAEESVGVSMDRHLTGFGRGSDRGVLLTAYKPDGVNFVDLRMTSRVLVARRSRSGKISRERPVGRSLDMPSLPARSPRQYLIQIFFDVICYQSMPCGLA